jgi:hypothetical protein
MHVVERKCACSAAPSPSLDALLTTLGTDRTILAVDIGIELAQWNYQCMPNTFYASLDIFAILPNLQSCMSAIIEPTSTCPSSTGRIIPASDLIRRTRAAIVFIRKKSGIDENLNAGSRGCSLGALSPYTGQ